MKCPKCGFNSFEYYDSCKKCSKELVGYKQAYSIRPLVLPQEAKAVLAEQFRTNESSTEETDAAPETHDDIFSFDLPDDSPLSPHEPVDDPFSFDEPSPAVRQAGNVTSQDDIFADLLESTPHAEESSFAAQVYADEKPAATSSSGSGEFDLESFSWDDSPVTPAAPGTADAVDAADDFDSLFGDMKEKSTK
jgi:predicted  nucleic acid-binding Zn-ribbon protein